VLAKAEEVERPLSEELEGDDGQLEVMGALQREDAVALVEVDFHARDVGAPESCDRVEHVVDGPRLRNAVEDASQH
jgi:hypothetical protein